MELPSKHHRIKILDGFRCISIILVITFHYFVRFGKGYDYNNYYPYKNVLADVFLFRYGYEGVYFFFIISGFVIYMTLTKCASLKEFAIKRFIRLWPTLLICSIITFVILSVFKFPGFETKVRYFLATLTITDPKIWSRVFHFKTMDLIDGVVWSLICEVNFYIIASVLFFINKQHFFKSWLIYVTVVLGVYILLQHLNQQNIIYYYKLILYPQFLVLFTLGIFFYLLYDGQAIIWTYKIPVFVLLCVQLFVVQSGVQASFTIVFLLFFVIFIYKPTWLGFLNGRVVTTIGIISYPLYLLHQNIGIVLINRVAQLFSSTSVWVTVCPVIIIVLIASYFIDRTVALYVSPWLRRVTLKKKL